ncbi:MAG: prepilin peptidase, partial [Pseudomonadota bacterium]
ARRAAAAHGDDASRGLLRGLAFALVDEADSVFIDEARTPLILSGPGRANFRPETLEAAAALADRLERPRDWRLQTGENRAELTEAGRARLAALGPTDGALANRVVREELALKALTARWVMRRDEHYLVRDGEVVIIDEYTGRTMPDRFWSDGLHQLVELSEGLEPSDGRVTLARTTYQRFFRRYDRLAGMSGTARETAAELHRVYRLPVATLPTHRPSRRRVLPARVHASAEAKWRDIAEEAGRLRTTGVPVLIGARSVAASRQASQALDAAGLSHELLSADQDAEEAEKIGRAGRAGGITVATNMAGRGADIKLDEAARACGGLHVLMSETHDSGRIDRQLMGRAGRQGDPGAFRAILSLEDPLLDRMGAWVRGLPPGPWRLWIIAFARRAAERTHARMRRDLLRQDERLGDALSFSGPED